jgi:hypothetical protein
MIPDLIEQGKKFTFENFATKSSHGYPNAFSDDWLVWIHHANQIVTKIGPSPIANSISRGLGTELLGEDRDRFEAARALIVSGLQAARRIQEPIPAADRTVTLGHNSTEQKAVLEKVDNLINAVQETNEFPGSEDEKEQTLAELSAARRLLEATRVRIDAIKTTLQPKLLWLAEKAASGIIVKLATDLLTYLATLGIF